MTELLMLYKEYEYFCPVSPKQHMALGKQYYVMILKWGMSKYWACVVYSSGIYVEMGWEFTMCNLDKYPSIYGVIDQ